ncbi:hypothetical protein [Streptomyces geysiriensis]|uniref:hypothetical protein n=1 Tax=Streptomyces geysiriensis TaxID=68207 RepID=UPI001C7CA907|nr:hypothetical protein [Streptomyces geysiriensis]MBX4179421.1 hypothetical protein [Streptomyces geysiriensis]
MQSPIVVGTYQSSIATFTRTLEPSLLAALRIDESVVLVTETLVSICKALTNSADTRPWQERIEDCFANTDDEDLRKILVAFTEEFQGDKPKNWIENFKSQTYRSFVERLLGAARYRLLVNAAKEDGAVVALAFRRGVRALMPFAVAWNDALSLMSKEQLKAANRADVLAVNAIQMVISIDDFLGEKVLSSLPMEVTAASSTDLAAWAPDGPDDLVPQFRALVTEASAKRVERANSPLVRKIRGARDALRYSEDGVSQAANSLIELLDRIMREAFPPAEVLLWVDNNLPDEPGLTHLKDGNRAPTKRAEALCFVYGGGPVVAGEATALDTGEGPSFLHDVVALVLVSARNKLQKLKHADSGSQEEREQLMMVLAALEGALMLGLTIGGLSAEYSVPPELPAA